MTPDQLIHNISEMRRLQKLYFKSRNQEVLKAAKSYESTVDGILEAYNRAKKKEAIPPELFDTNQNP